MRPDRRDRCGLRASRATLKPLNAQTHPQPRRPDVRAHAIKDRATGPAAERFEATTAAIGSRIGARDLGYNVTAVPPGKRAWPFHNHPAKEEMFLVLHGRGEVRIGSDRYPICTGDVIACPAGGAETAHQIINTAAVVV